MFEAYISKDRKLCLRPVDPDGEEELKELVKEFKQHGLSVLDIELQMPKDQYDLYKRYKQLEVNNRHYYGANHLNWPYALPFVLDTMRYEAKKQMVDTPSEITPEPTVHVEYGHGMSVR